MQGWIIPPPKVPVKSKKEFQEEREENVRRLARYGFLQSERIRRAMLMSPREDYIPLLCRDYAYDEVPLRFREREQPSPVRTVICFSTNPSALTKVTGFSRSASVPAMSRLSAGISEGSGDSSSP